MNAMTHLETLARGQRPENAGLLGTAKMTWSRLDRLSEEDILANFAAHPFDIDQDAQRILVPSGAAIVCDDRALIADLYDGRIGRLWRVGDKSNPPAEAAVHVAFDADMRQERGEVLRFRQEDHPDLPDSAVSGLLEACHVLIEKRRSAGALRVRGFIVRAFGTIEESVALLALFSLDDAQQRSATFDYAVVARTSSGDTKIVEDPEQPGMWTPRL